MNRKSNTLKSPSYFLSICRYDFLSDKLNRNYSSFRNFESLFEQHRKKTNVFQKY